MPLILTDLQRRIRKRLYKAQTTKETFYACANPTIGPLVQACTDLQERFGWRSGQRNQEFLLRRLEIAPCKLAPRYVILS
jgi:hypothetical protein